MFIRKPDPTLSPRITRLINEVECRDTVFRSDLNDEQRRKKAPWLIQDEFPEEKEILKSYNTGETRFGEALYKITKLMEKYYGCEYTLYGAIGRIERYVEEDKIYPFGLEQ